MPKMPEIRVIDIRKFESVEEMLQIHHSIWPPRIFLVNTSDEALEVLSSMTSLDDICKIEEMDEQLDRRIQLVEIRASILNELKNKNTDTLTGLKNRRLLEDDFQFLTSSMTPDEVFSVILIDLDNFKRLNDQFGHNAGDQILKKIGSILKRALVDSHVYRFGGEEFLILHRSGMEQSVALAEYLREEVSGTRFVFQGKETFITISIGVATQSGVTALKDLIAEADQYLYQAKSLGRNKVVCASEFNDIVKKSSELPEVIDFENRMKVVTQRLVKYLSIRYRNSVKQIQVERDIDGLTGVFVRRYFNDRFRREVENARKHNKLLSLLFIDLDHFGQINKNYGFINGDRVLKSCAGVFKKYIRLVDWIGRYGGEEFCIVLPDTGLSEAMEVGNRILVELRSTVVKDQKQREIIVTASIGAGKFSSNETETEFINRVSDCTLRAKENGRNQICC